MWKKAHLPLESSQLLLGFFVTKKRHFKVKKLTGVREIEKNLDIAPARHLFLQETLSFLRESWSWEGNGTKNCNRISLKGRDLRRKWKFHYKKWHNLTRSYKFEKLANRQACVKDKRQKELKRRKRDSFSFIKRLKETEKQPVNGKYCK